MGARYAKSLKYNIIETSSLAAYWNYYENEKHLVRNKNEQKIIRPPYISELCEH